MESMSSSSPSPFSAPHEPHNYEEYSMEDSLLFSDSLKDLKNLRTQLYSAAEYFEVSYTNDDQKQKVVNTLKDYTIHALVNTVDHLGSFSYKVTDILDEKVDDVSGTELRVSCIEQRLRTCQEYIDREGLSQQSLVLTAPKYHKRYILPVNGSMHGSKHVVSEYKDCHLDDENKQNHSMNVNGNAHKTKHVVSEYKGRHRESEDNQNDLVKGVKLTIKPPQQSTVRRGRSSSPSPRPPGSFSFFTEKTEKHKLPEKRSASPLRSMFPILRSASPAKPSSRLPTPNRTRPPTPVRSRQTTPIRSRPTTPTPGRPIIPDSFNTRTRHHYDTRKPSSTQFHEEDNQKDSKQNSSKSKRLFKALLSSRRKTKQDDTLYTYLDEY